MLFVRLYLVCFLFIRIPAVKIHIYIDIKGALLRSDRVTENIFVSKPIFSCYQRIKCIKTCFVVPYYVLYRFGKSV